MATPAFGTSIARQPLPFFERYPVARGHAKHFRDQGRMTEAIRVGLQSEAAEIRDAIDAALLRIGAIERAENGAVKVKFTKDPKTGGEVKEVIPSETVAINEQIAKHKLRLGEIHETIAALPRNRWPDIEDAAHKAHLAGTKFVELDMDDFATEAPTPELWKEVGTALKAQNEIKFADLPEPEIVANVTRAYRQIKKRGEVDFAQFRVGGHTDYQSGNYRLGTRNNFELPQKQLFADSGLEVSVAVDGKPVDTNIHGNILVHVDDTFAFLAALDDGDELLQRMIARALAVKSDKRQIAMANRPALLKVAAEKVLAAHRYLEFGLRRDEAAGLTVKRPRDTDPLTVLCWLEPAPKKPTPTLVAPVADENPAADDTGDFG